MLFLYFLDWKSRYMCALQLLHKDIRKNNFRFDFDFITSLCTRRDAMKIIVVIFKRLTVFSHKVSAERAVLHKELTRYILATNSRHKE